MANPRTVTTAAEVNGNQRLTNSPSLRQFGQGRRILSFRGKLITTSIPIGQFGRSFPTVSLPSGPSSTSCSVKLSIKWLGSRLL
jgi:hypothetical protein